MSTSKPAFFLIAFAMLVLPTFAAQKKNSFEQVEHSVEDRTGFAVSWQQDAAAREASLKTVRALLQKPLTVNSAVKIALLNNRNLQATFEDVGISAADLREAGMLKNPSIDLSIRFPDKPPHGTNTEEAAVFDLLDLLMLPLRKHVAAEKLASVQLHVADEVLRLVAEVKSAFYMLQADQSLLSQSQGVKDISSLSLQLAQKQHEAGNITDLALMQQQSTYDTARLGVVIVENQQREHREKLNRLLSVWGPDTAWKVAGELPPLPDKDVPLRGLESLAVSQRLDLAASHRELAEMVRSLGLVKTYRYVGALDVGVDTERDTDGTNFTGPRMRIELPIFNQGQARVAKGEAGLRRAELKFETLAIDIRSNVRELHGQLTAKRDLARFYQNELLPERKAISSAMLLRYNGMLTGNYELFTARSEEIEVAQKSVEALRDYWITRAELERAVGGSLKPRTQSAAKSSTLQK